MLMLPLPDMVCHMQLNVGAADQSVDVLLRMVVPFEYCDTICGMMHGTRS